MSEINFVTTDTEKIINDMIASFEAKAGRILSPSDPYRLLIAWAANIIVQERTLINQAAKQNLLQYAAGEYLDALAELFHDTTRLEATAAVVTMKFELSEAQKSAVTIQAGTRITADSKIYFATTKSLTIVAGETTGSVTAKCMETGIGGNGYVIGQLNILVDVFPYFSSCENTDISAGGTDKENDIDFKERIILSNDTWSTAGPGNAYVYHAKSVSADIVDAAAVSDAPGEVKVYILCDNGKLPSEALVKMVDEALNADKVRPLTDKVTVSAPEVVNYGVNLTYYINVEDENEAETIEKKVNEAVEKFKKWQYEKMGRDINQSYLIKLIMDAGAKRVDIISPNFTVVNSNNIAICSSQNINYGGVEDD